MERIPENIYAGRTILSTCVEHWNNPKLPELIQKQLPKGWQFAKHIIREYDSFGPVTSELFLIHDGVYYSELI